MAKEETDVMCYVSGRATDARLRNKSLTFACAERGEKGRIVKKVTT